MSKEQLDFLTATQTTAVLNAVEGQVTGLAVAVGVLQGQVAGLDTATQNLDSRVSTLEQGNPSAIYHRNTQQTFSTTGAPATASINWNDKSTWSDTSAITQNTPTSANFTVQTAGVYRISAQVRLNNLSSATFTDTTMRLMMGLTRGGNTGIALQTNSDITNSTPNFFCLQIDGLYELQPADEIFFQLSYYMSAGSFIVSGQNGNPIPFILNTFWSWELVKPLLL